jgi:hypothetical protein
VQPLAIETATIDLRARTTATRNVRLDGTCCSPAGVRPARRPA